MNPEKVRTLIEKLRSTANALEEELEDDLLDAENDEGEGEDSDEEDEEDEVEE